MKPLDRKAVESVIQSLLEEIEEGKSVLSDIEQEAANIRERFEVTKQALSIAKANLKFLKHEAPVVVLEKYREALKLVQDNLKSQKWLQTESERNLETRKHVEEALRGLNQDLKKHLQELTECGQIYQYPKP